MDQLATSPCEPPRPTDHSPTKSSTIAINDVDEFDVGAVTDTDGTANGVDENATVGTVVRIDVTASDADASNNTITYSLVDDDGGRFTINSSTGVVTVNSAIDRETDGASRNITVRATSSDTSFTDQVFAIIINPLNDNNPVITSDGGGASASINVLENDLYVSTVVASDADLPAETLTYSIIGGVDAAKFTIDGSTGVLTFVASPDFEAPTDLGANNVYDLIVQASDGTWTDSQSITVTVVDVADSGQYLDLFNSVSYSNSDGTEAWTSSWVESDAGGGGASSGYFKVSGGTLYTAAHNVGNYLYREADLSNAVSASLSFSYANQLQNSASLVVQASSNGGGSYTTLTGLTFDEFSNPGSGTKSVDISSYISGNSRIRVYITGSETGAGKYDFHFDNVQISYVSNSAPAITSNGAGASASINVGENSSTVTTVIAVDGDVPAQTLTYSIVGGVDAGKFTINSSSGALTFLAAPDFEAPTDWGSNSIYDVIVEVSDGIAIDTQSIAVTVTDVDEFDVGAVSDSDGTVNAVDENAFVGTLVGIDVSASDADATNNTITYSLVDDDGGRFTINSGTGVVTVNGAIDRETDGASRNITVRATSSDSSFTDQVFAITINDVDEFDVGVITDSDAAADVVVENAGIGASVGITALASDADATNNSIAYTLDDDAGGRFAINGSTGQITVNAALDYETNTSHNVIVRAASSDGSSSTQSFTINVSDVSESGATAIVDNDAAADAVAENSIAGTTVGVTAFSDDADGTDTISYSLDDNDGGRFSIDTNTGIVTVAGTIDREADGASRSITVRATSTDGSFQTRVFSITIDDVDEFDVGAVTDSNASANSVDENAANGTIVGVTALAADADATNNAITYALDDNAGGRFTIEGSTGMVTVADGTLLDREAAASHNITVRATSSDGSFNTAVMTIDLNDVDEFDVAAVSDSDLTANTVDENAANGTVVGVTALAADADATNNAITYTLDDNAGGRFTIDGSTGVVTVADGTLLDREAAASHNITVRATSSDGSFNTAVMTINLNDVDEFDVAAVSDSDLTANAVDENAANGTVVGVTALASDADATNNAITYTLDDNAGGRFTIEGSTGVVTVADGTLLDREAAASHNITVRATSSDGSFNTAVITINLNDVDEFNVGAVTDTDGATNEIDENVIVGTAVGITATASDADATTSTVTYSLFDDDGGRFSIDSNSGVVTVAGAIDREADSPIRNITVRATSADGSFTDQIFAITINDVDEFDVTVPTDVDGATDEVTENVIVGTTVGITANAFDLDATNNTVTYSLTSNPDGLFTIDANTGVVSTAAVIDREVHGATRSITVEAASSDGSVASQSFNITITDVDEFDVGVITDSDVAADVVAENAGIGASVGITALASDADATNNSITYTLDDDAGGRFAINGSTGQITVNAALDYETNTSHNVIVRAASSDGSSSTQSFTINVSDVSESGATAIVDNDAAADAVAENSIAGTTVGVTAFSDDADGTDTITYSLDDNDGGRFSIDTNTGIVTVAGAIDREADGASRSITVRATSTDGSFQTRVFSITIDDVDEFDVGAVSDSDLTANAVDENAANGSVVGVTTLASDADATNNTITYTLDDNAGGRFTIDGSTGMVTVADGTLLDREAVASHNITVRATSSDGSFNTAVMTINLNDVDEFDVGAVTDVDGVTNEVDENAVAGTVVGITADASDADATTNTITYSLQDNDGGRFSIDSSTGMVNIAGAIDREADGGSRNITVRATSADGSFTDQVFAININDTDEFDVGAISDSDAAADTVAEDAANGTVVGVTALASDADATNNTITYSLDDNAGGRFAIDGSTGVVTVADGTLLDRESAASHNITVRASSSDGSSNTQNMAISVIDVDEFDVGPVADTDGTVNEVEENVVVGTVVGITASANDADATTNSITYTLQDNDGGRFSIDSSTGIVTVAGAIDREVDGPTRNVTVRAASSDGSVTDQIFAININDVDEFDVGAVTDVDGAANEVDENSAIGTVVGITASAADADATTNAITYSLQDNDGGRFSIDSGTGIVRVAGADQPRSRRTESEHHGPSHLGRWFVH